MYTVRDQRNCRFSNQILARIFLSCILTEGKIQSATIKTNHRTVRLFVERGDGYHLIPEL